MPESLASETTFAIPSRVALSTARPVIESLIELDQTVHAVCPRELHGEIRDLVASGGGRLLELERLVLRHRFSDRLHRLILLAMTRGDFSSSYRGLVSKYRPDMGRKFRLAYLLSRPLPKWPRQRINGRLKTLFSRLIRNPFPSERVVAVSKATTPHLLCARGVRVVTLMESWDHAASRPAGYPSRLVIAWNADLGRDWTHFQGDSSVMIGYPLKLGYVIEDPVRRDETRSGPRRPVAMYPVGAESRSPRLDWHRDELKVIEAVCQATERLGWDLLIKPKPAGVEGEYDGFARRYRHVTIGTEQAARWCVDYDLSDEYNRSRRNELASVDYVFNCWTTFALDAACAGRPIIQLDLRDRSDVPSLSRAYEHDHIRTYLVGNPARILQLDPSRPLADELASRLPHIGDRAEAFSRELGSWLRPRRSRREALCEIARAIAKV